MANASIHSPPFKIKRDLSGRRFGLLTAIRPLDKNKYGLIWLCKCDCGKEHLVQGTSLTLARSLSCGCMRSHRFDEDGNKVPVGRKHGRFGTRLYQTWHDMKRRCYNADWGPYKYYGAKGVIICDEWLADQEKFFKWAEANGYQEHLTIERNDVFGGYSPDNCRWATWAEQAKNKRPRASHEVSQSKSGGKGRLRLSDSPLS